MMMKISKILNNNAVIVRDGEEEKVAIGTGVALTRRKTILLTPIKFKNYLLLKIKKNYNNY